MLVSVRGASGSPGRWGRRNRGPAPSFSSRSSVAFISPVDLAPPAAMTHTKLTQLAAFLEELLEREAITCHCRRTGRFVGAHCPSAYADLASRVETIARCAADCAVSRAVDQP